MSVFGVYSRVLMTYVMNGRLAQLARALARQAGPVHFSVHFLFNFKDFSVYFLSNYITSTTSLHKVNKEAD